MPRKAGIRTAPSQKRHQPLIRFVTKAHREEWNLDEDAAARVLKELKYTTPGKGKPSRG